MNASDCKECDILVVGGGLGGLALAVGLQNLNLNWLLCEAASELRTATGTLIGLGSNGFTALDSINPNIVTKLK
jgi:salicylate hydroxylase